MTASRRGIGTLPALMVSVQRARAALTSVPVVHRKPFDDLCQAFEDVARQQEEFNRKVWGSRESLPSVHGETHKGGDDSIAGHGDPSQVQAGVDADRGDPHDGFAPHDHVHDAETAVPPNPTGKTAAEGTGTAFMRADAIVEQGIVTTKGDILGRDASTAERLPVGANNTVLSADSGETTGLKWIAGGSIIVAVTSVSTNTTLDDTHCVVLVDASGGAVTITLPATATAGRSYVVKKTDSSANYVTVDGNGNDIDGDSDFDLEGEDEAVKVVGDGTDWWIV